MRAIRLCFIQMLTLMKRDMMLLAACLIPPVAGTAIKFFIPFAERLLVNWINIDAVLSPYYGLFDIFLASISPGVFCFISAMVMLEERDDHIESYLFITGLGRKGYIIARIFVPALCAFIVTGVLLIVFRLSYLPGTVILFISLTGTAQGVITALLIVSLSSNKLEGMAIAKLSTLLLSGAIVAYFIPYPIHYVLFFLPSFWIGQTVKNSSLGAMILAILTTSIWIVLLQQQSKNKL